MILSSLLRSWLCLFSMLVSALVLHSASAFPKYEMTSNAFRLTAKALKAHQEKVNSLLGVRDGATPIFYLHAPGKRVYGTVLLFHGFSQKANGSSLQAKYLFDKKFNVVSLNLAGHAQKAKYWPITVLRQETGYEAVRKAILKDAYLKNISDRLLASKTVEEQFMIVQSLSFPLMPRFFRALKKSLGPKEYRKVRAAFSLMRPGVRRSGIEKLYRKYFVTSHPRYESDPLEKLSLVSALPGPVNVVGFSFGTIAAINLAGYSKVISKMILLAPYLGRFNDAKRTDLGHFYYSLASVDLYAVVMPDGNKVIRVPGRALAPGLVNSGLATRDWITNSVRETTKTFCFVAEDDVAVDVEHDLEVCRSKLGGNAFVYPKKLKLNHFITPETGSRYSMSLLQEMANFFINGRVNRKNLLVPNKPFA